MNEPLDYPTLRERIARALWANEPPFIGCDWDETEADDEDKDYYRRQADAALAELRISRVGSVRPDYDGYPVFSGTTPSTEDYNHERECHVYRFDTPSWQSSTLVAPAEETP